MILFNQMVKYNNYNDLDEIFSSLSDPTRRDILLRISMHDCLTVNEIAKPYLENMSLPAVSKHLKVLEKSNLISREKNGRSYSFKSDPKQLLKIEQYISFFRKFWNSQLDSLEEYLSKGVKQK